MCVVDPVEGVGNPVRRNAVDGILKVVVWEGNRKREGENDEVEDMIVCSPIMVHTSMHLTRSNSDYPNGNDDTRTSSIINLIFLFTRLPSPSLRRASKNRNGGYEWIWR